MIKIGDFAKLFGVTIKTVRYYEKMGLLIPCYVDVYTGYRYYNEENVKRMQEVMLLKKLGFTLEEIKYFDDVHIKNKITDLEQEIRKINNQLKLLKQASSKGKEVLKMHEFLNDEKVIGKWNLLGIAKNIDDAKKRNLF